MTRARRRLILTSAGRRRVFGSMRATEPSRLSRKIPDELVQRYDSSGTAILRGPDGYRARARSFPAA